MNVTTSIFDRLSGISIPFRLWLARVSWLLIALASVSLFVRGIPIFATNLQEQYGADFGLFFQRNSNGEIFLVPEFGEQAAQLGVMERDVLVEVNGASVPPGDNPTTDDLIPAGAAGTEVTLQIRTGSGPLREITLIRGGENGRILARYGLTTGVVVAYAVGLEIVVALGFIGVAGFIFWRRGQNWLVWLTSLSLIVVFVGAASLPAQQLHFAQPYWQYWLDVWISLALGGLLLFLFLFPDGRFVPRWTAVVMLVWFIWAVAAWYWPALYFWQLDSAAIVLSTVAWLGIGVAAQVWRYRYVSTARQRQQTKWIVWGIGVAGLALVVQLTVERFLPDSPLLFDLLVNPLARLAQLLIPVTFAIAILQRRLWEIDLIVNRTLVYGGLTALITAVYILLVGGLGTLAINQSGQILGLVLATLVVIVGLRPLQQKWQTVITHYVPFPQPPPMPQQKNNPPLDAPPAALPKRKLRDTAVLRMVWLLLPLFVVGLVITAVPYRIQMLVEDVYGFGPSLAEVNLSLSFVAGYFVFWELVVVAGSLLVAVLIVWRRADDLFAMLVAISLTLFGLLPPLVDGLSLLNPQLIWLVIALRVAVVVCMMAVFCLFPNGRFQPGWTRWLFVGWLVALTIGHLIKPDVLADTAVLPNTVTLSDALYLLVGAAWFMAAIGGQVVRYLRISTPEERQQTKWVIFGFAVVILFSLLSTLLLINVPLIRDDGQARIIFILVMGALYLLAALLLPITIALAMLRYRLWEVDIFINRTLVYGGLTALITAVYILLVGGIGVFTTSQSGQVIGLIVATLVVIALFRPLLHILQQGTDRLVPRPAVLPTAVSQLAPTTMAGNTLRLARLLWAGMLLLGLVMFVVSTAVIVRQNLWLPIIDGSYPVEIALLQNSVSFTSFAIWIISYAQMVAFAVVGLFLFWRKSADRMGILASLMFIAIGFGFTANIVLLPIFLPEWHVVVTIYQGIMFGAIVLFLCWFPDGRFYPNWTKAVIVGWIVYAAGWLIWPELNPHRATVVWPIALWMAWIWLGVIAQFLRYRRRSDDAERQQTKWVIGGFVGANFGLFIIVLTFSSGMFTQQTGVLNLFATLLFILAGMSAMLIPVTISIALFRYRLWEIDFFINRTLVYGGLTAMVLFIYALLVGGLSLMFQTQNSLFISLLATGLIAVLFQPIRARLQRGVNRLMFGERDDPYGILSHLGRQLRETAVPNQTLPAITATITQTLKLPYAAIELADAEGSRQLSAVSGQPVELSQEWPLLYQGELVGWLEVAPRSPSEAFTSKERHLLDDIAAQAGAAAYSVRLTTALQKSRERLVLAREEERRRIRRDLHDELGPSLASQTFKLDAAIDLLETDPQAAAELLQSLKTHNQALVGDIRRLVYELRPPALDDLGLMGALHAHLSQIDDPSMLLTAVPDPLPPLPAAVEVAAYRITLEATNNVVRHAQAQACTIQIEADDARLTLTISDDGVGLPDARQNGVGLASMRERAEELGGVLLIGNLADGGVRITAVLPLS